MPLIGETTSTRAYLIPQPGPIQAIGRLELRDHETLTIGRVSTCSIIIKGEGVSRLHAQVVAQYDGVVVVDLGSRNGTHVNGERIATRMLSQGDEIRIGGARFKVEIVNVGDRQQTFGPQTISGEVEEDEVSADGLIRKRLCTSDLAWSQLGGVRTVRRNPLEVLDRLGSLLNRETSVESAARQLIDLMLEVFPAERACLLMSNANGRVVAHTSKSNDGGTVHPVVPQSILREVTNDRLSIITADARADHRFSGHTIMIHNVRSVMCVPLETGERVLGALYLDSLAVADAFKDGDLEFLAVIGKFTAEALHRIKSVQRSQETLLGAISALVYAVEAKDRYTAGHSVRVSEFGVIVAGKLDLSEAVQRDVRLAGLLHDIGKIGVPESILSKNGRLTEAEYEIIKQHPERGAVILEHLDGLECVIDGVRHHHERWDGCGYPHGKKATQIPMIARIIAVVDAIDAMCSGRTYTANRTIDEIAHELERCKSKHFDPDVADAAVACLRSGLLVPAGLTIAA